jgi:hypothetical protein
MRCWFRLLLVDCAGTWAWVANILRWILTWALEWMQAVRLRFWPQMPPPNFGAPPGAGGGTLVRRPVKPKDLGQKLKETILHKCVPVVSPPTGVNLRH